MPTTSKPGLLPDAPDIEAYFRRLGYAGPRVATFDTLAALHSLHPQAIPFENLDTLLKRPIELSAAAFSQKMLSSGRGGWCFEQSLLFAGVLQALGFQVTGYAARVLWGVPEGVTRARTHMLLGVECAEAGPCIVDVGFGGPTLTGPLRLIPDIEQATPHEPFRLLAAGRGNFALEMRLHGQWQALYSFDLQPQMLADYQLSNWYLGNFPESPFVRNLMAARVTPDGRYALFNNRLATHRLHAESEHVLLTSVGELRGALEGVLRITLPDDPGLPAVLERIAGMPG